MMIKKVSVLFCVMILFVAIGCRNNVEMEEAVTEETLIEETVTEETLIEETVTEEALIEIPPRRNPTTDLFSQNQMNSRRWVAFNLPAFITEDSIYMIANRQVNQRGIISGNDIVVFDHDFVYQGTRHVTDTDDMWIAALDATADAVYFTMYTSDHESSYLYRYDIQASESTLITEDVVNKLIIDDLVFHRQNIFDGQGQRPPLYTLDLVNLERELILDLQTEEFFIDRENESIIFISESYDIHQADMTGENDDLLEEGARTIWSFDGERILYTSYSNPREFWLFDLESDTSFFVGNNLLNDVGGMFEVGFVGDYIFVATGDFIDVLSPNNPADRRRLLDQEFVFFTVLFDQIIFTTRGFQMHIVDLEGNVDRLNFSRD